MGADTACSVNALAEAVADVMGVPGHPVEHLPARNEVTVAYSEHAACRQVFPDQPVTALRDGLTRMAEWAKVVGARETPEFAGIEIRKNLPASWA